MALRALIRFELTGRRAALGLALGLGLFWSVLPWLPGLRGAVDPDRHAAGVFFGSLLMAAAFGGVWGATMLGRDLENRRLGFYISRPLSGTTLYWGKVLAGWGLSLFACFLALLPSVVMGRMPAPASASDVAKVLLGLGALSLGPLLLLHVLSVQLRARSPWLVVDLGAWLLLGWSVTTELRLLLRGGAFTMVPVFLGVLLALGVAGCAVAGWVATVRGRADLRATHRALSLAFAAWLVGLSALGAGAVRWVLHPAVSELRDPETWFAAPQGDWFQVEGEARGRGGLRAAFLMNAATGAAFPVAGQLVGFSEDGAWAAWASLPMDGTHREVRVWTLDLGRPGARPEAVSLWMEVGPEVMSARRAWPWAIPSPDGARVAVLWGDRYALVDRARQAEVASGTWKGVRGWTWFEDAQTLRSYVEDPVSRSLVVEVLDLGTRRITRLGTPRPRSWSVRDRSRDQVLLSNRESREDSVLLLADARDLGGATVLEPGRWGRGASACFLGDGRVAGTSLHDGQVRLAVPAALGRPRIEGVLPGIWTEAMPLGDGRPGSLRVWTRHAGRGETALWEVELGTGVPRQVGAGLTPACRGTRASALASRLFWARDGSLVLDPFGEGGRTVLRHARSPIR